MSLREIQKSITPLRPGLLASLNTLWPDLLSIALTMKTSSSVCLFPKSEQDKESIWPRIISSPSLTKWACEQLHVSILFIP